MINEEIKRNFKLEKLLEIVNITEEELEKSNYKEKQKYYNAKSKLGTIVHRSKDEKGNGITLRKCIKK